MFSQRRLCCILLTSLALSGSAEPLLASWNPFRKKPKAPATQKAAKAPRPPRKWESSSMIHTQAHFIYGGKVLSPVNEATAVLYNSTSPASQQDVDAMNGARNSVQQAQHVCSAFIPGQDSTIGPGGDVFFDYVDRGSYWILVCAQVKFSGMAKPVWVAATVPVASAGFTEDNYPIYNVGEEVQINLDPYAKELQAKPIELPPPQIAAVEEPFLQPKVPFVPPAPFATAAAAAAYITAPTAAPAPLSPQATAAPAGISAPNATPAPLTPQATAAPAAISAPSTTLIRLPGATAAPTAIAAPTMVPVSTPKAAAAPTPIAVPSATLTRTPGATAAPAPITVPSKSLVRMPGATAAPPPITAPGKAPVPTPAPTTTPQPGTAPDQH